MTHLYKQGYEWGRQRNRGQRVPKWVDMLNDVDYEQFMLGVEASEQEVS